MTTNNDFNGLKKVNKLFFNTVYFFLLVLSIYSCASSEIANSEDVNQAKIHQYYYVGFDANGGQTYYVMAQFRFGGSKGTTLKLSSPSKVSVNDMELSEQTETLRGCFYETTLNGSNVFNFKFIDTQKKEYINKCEINSLTIVATSQIDADKKSEIAWTGKPLEANETVTLTIEDNEGNKATAYCSVKGSNSVIINPNDMENLIQGKGQIYMNREANINLQQAADDGGSINTDYKSEIIGVNILKVPVAKKSSE